uniref:Uncharacterized protein n=1 Tax=viral metagenome TaxID=1070528 RepID=A0A6C0HK14_9ZZZZ
MAVKLHEAVVDGDAQKARALLNAGADPLAIDDEGHTPAFYAFDLNKPELYAVLVVSHPEILEDERVPRIQDMPDDRQQLEFLNAITAEIERLQDNDAVNNLRLHNPKIRDLEMLKDELNFAAENHGMMGARRRRRRQRRGRKTVKARKAMKRKRNTMRRR